VVFSRGARRFQGCEIRGLQWTEGHAEEVLLEPPVLATPSAGSVVGGDALKIVAH